MKKSKIPKFKSIEEEANFWDTHDTTEFLDEFEVAHDLVFIRPEAQVVSIRFERDFADQVKAYAKKVGIPYTLLIRMWTIRGFRQELLAQQK